MADNEPTPIIPKGPKDMTSFGGRITRRGLKAKLERQQYRIAKDNENPKPLVEDKEEIEA